MTTKVLADRLDLLDEIASIEADLARLEQAHGPHVEFEDTRRRVRAVRVTVLGQLQRALAETMQ